MSSNLIKNKSVKATKTLTTSYGIIVGLAAILHGFFEILQGNKIINNHLIDAIGPNQKFWEYSILHAVTYAPTYLIAGILAIICGISLLFWSVYFVGKKFNSTVILILVVITFLVGGGYGPPISIGLLAILASLLINRPIVHLKNLVPSNSNWAIQKTWPWTLIAFIIIFGCSVAINVVGWPLILLLGTEGTNTFVWFLAFVMIVIMTISFVHALIFDSIS